MLVLFFFSVFFHFSSFLSTCFCKSIKWYFVIHSARDLHKIRCLRLSVSIVILAVTSITRSISIIILCISAAVRLLPLTVAITACRLTIAALRLLLSILILWIFRIRIAAQKAGIEKYNLTEYPVVKSPIEELFAEFTTEVKARLLKEELGTFYTTWEQMKNKVENQGLLARIPYDIAFH